MDLKVDDIVLGKGTVIKNYAGTELVTAEGVFAGDIQAAAGSIGTAELANASVTPAKLVETAVATATADGTGTGSITVLGAFKKFVDVTSASATNQISLPGISASTIGQEIFLTVAANGYELITPASSGTLINQVDGDGTNQLDVAANTTVRCTQISATAWLAETIAAATIAVTAPDND